MIILRLLLLLTNLHLKLLSTQGTGADKLLSTQRVNQMLMTGEFPSDLKISRVKPLFKSGDASLFSNYRPISLPTYIITAFVFKNF